MRAFIGERTHLRELHDLTLAKQVFDAAVYPSVVTATRPASTRPSTSTLSVVSHKDDKAIEWTVTSDSLPFDRSRGSPWILVPGEVRTAFDVVRQSGITLAESPIKRPLLGVKTGCNAAFLVTRDSPVEKRMLRPVIRGEKVQQWRLPKLREQILWTHDEHGPLKVLPPGTAEWLSRWRRDLERRADSRGRHRWWMLFRTEAAASHRARVVWADIGKRPKAVVIPKGNDAVPLNTCYVARCRDDIDAHLLTVILNSRLAASWLALLAEPARGGYMRFMGWTMSLLPLPKNWDRARNVLAPIGIAAAAGRIPSDDELTEAVLCVYGLTYRDVAPLIEWSQ